MRHSGKLQINFDHPGTSKVRRNLEHMGAPLTAKQLDVNRSAATLSSHHTNAYTKTGSVLGFTAYVKVKIHFENSLHEQQFKHPGKQLHIH